MIPDEMLDAELLYAEGGHASEIALATLADGQVALVPEGLRAHVERCASCSAQLGAHVMLSERVGHELHHAARHTESTVALTSRTHGLFALAAGLFIAALGASPRLLDVPALGAELLDFFHRSALFGRGATHLASSLVARGSESGLVLTYTAAAALIGAGLVLVRVLPRLAKEGSR